MRVLRRVLRAVLRRGVAEGFSTGFLASVSSEVFSGDGFASAVSVGGRGIVAPTEDNRFASLVPVTDSVAGMFSATGMPPLNGSNAPAKRM